VIHQYEYPRPAYTADCVVFNSAEVLLIRRGKEPFKGSLALPGGFVNDGETSEAAARRELREETGLDLEHCKPIGVFDLPGRDPRGWTVSAAYVFYTRQRIVRGMDDAISAIWVPLNKLDRQSLAFDHIKIIDSALKQERV
jgi:8-oxo-dGTP diphosphatase